MEATNNDKISSDVPDQIFEASKTVSCVKLPNVNGLVPTRLVLLFMCKAVSCRRFPNVDGMVPNNR